MTARATNGCCRPCPRHRTHFEKSGPCPLFYERCVVCLGTRATADTIAVLPSHPAFMDSTFLDALHQYADEKQTFLDLLDSQPGQPHPNPQEPQP